MLWFPWGLSLIACVYDLRSREIPDWIPVLLVASAGVAVGLAWIPVSFPQLVLGVLIGFSATAVFGLAGGLGGGDVKLVAALGAWLGPIPLLVVLFWTALFGLMLAIGFRLGGRKDLPYAPAIAAGFAFFLCWPRAILWLLQVLHPGI